MDNQRVTPQVYLVYYCLPEYEIKLGRIYFSRGNYILRFDGHTTIFVLLVSETKVQPLVSLVLCRPQIVVLLIRAHCIPYPIACLIPPNVVDFDEDCHDHVPTDEGEKNLVSTSIERSIVL